ncbi:MAG: DUF1127 domain-containing protein [Rhodobacteraceae bacterium]|nr:DUF1127 domain-containing protein [Paracoccaceae bacterium]
MQTLALKTITFPAISLNTVALWVLNTTARARSRAALAKLDHAALDDIGISARDAQIEAAKPFWL